MKKVLWHSSLDPGVELLDAAGEVGQVLDVVTVLGSLGLHLADQLTLVPVLYNFLRP